jgi:hypothetical protein
MNELIHIIKILGVGYDEILIDIDLSNFTINSIELDGGNIIIHIFNGVLDLHINYEDLDENDRQKILTSLKNLIYN